MGPAAGVGRTKFISRGTRPPLVYTMTDKTILELSLAYIPCSSGQTPFDELRSLLFVIPENFCTEALQERCFVS